MSHSPCEILTWDSTFFHVRIARVLSGTMDASEHEAVERWCRAAEIDCLYFLADSCTEDEAEWRRARGFVCVDTRVTLEAPVPSTSTSPSAIRSACERDIPTLSRIAADAHQSTRFYADLRFAPAASRFYGFWIEHSVRDPSVTVLVPEPDPAAGYVTCYATRDGIGQIGLVGVAASSRGQGLGRRLVGAALNCFTTWRCSTGRVVTQARNTAASGLYRTAGFRPVRMQWWYHRWFTTLSAR